MEKLSPFSIFFKCSYANLLSSSLLRSLNVSLISLVASSPVRKGCGSCPRNSERRYLSSQSSPGRKKEVGNRCHSLPGFELKLNTIFHKRIREICYTYANVDLSLRRLVPRLQRDVAEVYPCRERGAVVEVDRHDAGQAQNREQYQGGGGDPVGVILRKRQKQYCGLYVCK